MASVLSDIIQIPHFDNVNSIESYLVQKYGDIIRWAIVEVNDAGLKVSISYKTKEG